MKVSKLVAGDAYALLSFPNEKLIYQGLAPEDMAPYVGDHIFFNVKPLGRIPGCVCSDAQVEQVIVEFTEVH